MSGLLFRHIKKELPKLREELDHIYGETLLGLQTLGQGRSTVHQQKEFLMQLSLQFCDLTKAGVNGHYESDYFGKVDTRSNFGSTLHERRLRAAVQLLNVKFAKAMCKLGHKYKCEGHVNLEDDESDGDADTPASADDSDQDAADSELGEADSLLLPVPKVLCRSKALDWVKTVLIHTRGRELPGNLTSARQTGCCFRQVWSLFSTAELPKSRAALNNGAYLMGEGGTTLANFAEHLK